MGKYKLSEEAKEDLIRIHHYGIRRFGMAQADKYFDEFYQHFEMIADKPFSFEAIDHIRPGYRRCVCGVDSIIYKVEGEIVEIISIVGRQNINDIL